MALAAETTFLKETDVLCINLYKKWKFLTFLFCTKGCYHLALLHIYNLKEIFVRKNLSKVVRSNIDQA